MPIVLMKLSFSEENLERSVPTDKFIFSIFLKIVPTQINSASLKYLSEIRIYLCGERLTIQLSSYHSHPKRVICTNDLVSKIDLCLSNLLSLQ